MELSKEEKLKAMEYCKSIYQKNSQWLEEKEKNASEEEKYILTDFYIQLYTETKNEIKKLPFINADDETKIKIFELEQRANYINNALASFMTTRDYLQDADGFYKKDPIPHTKIYK